MDTQTFAARGSVFSSCLTPADHSPSFRCSPQIWASLPVHNLPLALPLAGTPSSNWKLCSKCYGGWSLWDHSRSAKSSASTGFALKSEKTLGGLESLDECFIGYSDGLFGAL